MILNALQKNWAYEIYTGTFSNTESEYIEYWTYFRIISSIKRNATKFSSSVQAYFQKLILILVNDQPDQ